jgi:hypothetical protein
MKRYNEFVKWILNHTWAILVSYIISMIALLLIHDAFGFSMENDGTYLSNATMHIGSGFLLALGTGFLQRELLKKHFRVSYFWVMSLILGFVVAEMVAGIVLWKLEIYRGLINIFNTDVHFPESMIFAFAGLVAGVLQFRLLKPYYKKRIYWIMASALGWAFFILSTYLSLFALIIGAIFYGALSGLALYTLMEFKNVENT